MLSLDLACLERSGETSPDGLPLVRLEAVPRPREIEMTVWTKNHELVVFRRGERRFWVTGQSRSFDEMTFEGIYPSLYEVYRQASSDAGAGPTQPASEHACQTPRRWVAG